MDLDRSTLGRALFTELEGTTVDEKLTRMCSLHDILPVVQILPQQLCVLKQFTDLHWGDALFKEESPSYGSFFTELAWSTSEHDAYQSSRTLNSKDIKRYCLFLLH